MCFLYNIAFVDDTAAKNQSLSFEDPVQTAQSFSVKSASVPTSKAKNHLSKFRYPRVDPKTNLIVDNRSEEQKLESILHYAR